MRNSMVYGISPSKVQKFNEADKMSSVLTKRIDAGNTGLTASGKM